MSLLLLCRVLLPHRQLLLWLLLARLSDGLQLSLQLHHLNAETRQRPHRQASEAISSWSQTLEEMQHKLELALMVLGCATAVIADPAQTVCANAESGGLLLVMVSEWPHALQVRSSHLGLRLLGARCERCQGSCMRSALVLQELRPVQGLLLPPLGGCQRV